MRLQINTPKWGIPFLQPKRYKGAYGGRGSGKSHFFAEMCIESHVINQNKKTVCIREVQKSIDRSVKSLLESKIKSLNVGSYFTVQHNCIKSNFGDGVIIFEGMQNHTADSIKSLEGMDCAWVEEAQKISQYSLDLLRPTIRKEKSELWFTWNPHYETDAIDVFLRSPDIYQHAIVQKVNFTDNPWFPAVLRAEMEYDKSRDTDKYKWIWEGEYLQRSSQQVFKNWSIDEFETPKDANLIFGADWGYGIDPTVLVRAFIEGRKLYIDHEAYKVKCEIVDTPSLFLTVPEAEKYPIIADSGRPDIISHMRNHGFDNVMPAVKGPGSVEQGVNWLTGYEIIAHERCKHTIEELRTYSYKVDKHTNKVSSELLDKDNHVIDALRYACEGARRLEQGKQRQSPTVHVQPIVHKWR